MELNAQQVAGWLRVALSAGGPIAALAMSKMGVSEKDWALYTEVALAIVPGLTVAVWSWYRNRKATQIRLVDKMPEVATIVVKDNANGTVGALAQSEAHPNIVTESQNQSDAMGGEPKPSNKGD